MTDKNGIEVKIGDTIRGKSMDGPVLEFEVVPDAIHGMIAVNDTEVWDVSPKIFHQYEIIEPRPLARDINGEEKK